MKCLQRGRILGCDLGPGHVGGGKSVLRMKSSKNVKLDSSLASFPGLPVACSIQKILLAIVAWESG